METNASMSQINDQNILLKAQLSAAGANQSVVHNNHKTPNNDDHFKVDQLQNQIQSLMTENSHQKTRMSFYEAENSRLLAEIEQFKAAQNDAVSLGSDKSELVSKIESMTKDQEDLLELLADQDLKLKDYRRKMRDLGQQVEASDDEN